MVSCVNSSGEYIDYLKKQIQSENPGLSSKQIDKEIINKMKEGDEEANDRIQILIDKFDKTHYKVERMNYKKKKYEEKRYNKHIDPRRKEYFELVEKFKRDLREWKDNEEVVINKLSDMAREKKKNR